MVHIQIGDHYKKKLLLNIIIYSEYSEGAKVYFVRKWAALSIQIVFYRHLRTS